ncbi:hypothetical protein M0R45_021614 [Rubus argutus]|uniref:Uncharacterized protein n=1 Tax=Rubus argutus TaxID=59490 RepID=A0AAW1XBY6_RUBAR
MKVEVEVISKEIIKPSSPTPEHLRHYQFSFLDQTSPLVYNPLLLFYEFNAETQPNITEISNHLKNLSQSLDSFLPTSPTYIAMTKAYPTLKLKSTANSQMF